MKKTAAKTLSVTLQNPIIRDGKPVSEIELTAPTGAHLRGVSLLDLLRLDTSAVVEVVPRISQPRLTKQEISSMSAPDLVDLASATASFLTRAEPVGQE